MSFDPVQRSEVDNSFMIQAHNLEISVGFKKLLCNVNLKLNSGTSLALVGPNGIGKTSLLRVLAGLCPPSKGEVWCLGESLWPARNVSFEHLCIYLASQPALLLDQTVYQNLESMCNIFGKDPTWTEANEALRKVSLENRGKQQTRGLSTGQKRRLTLALLHILNPSVALLDEPSNGLDALGQSLCHSLILDLIQKGNSLIIATHDQKIIDLCSYVVDVSTFVPKQQRKRS